MTKEQQDLAWACLPKEAREEIRKRYKGWIESLSFGTEIILYNDLFGEHNLTSDTEPEEMLMVERKKVIDLYATMDKAFPREAAYSVQSALQTLFGDKCLPDKELEHRLEQASVQVEPKFKEGDEIVVKYDKYKGLRGIIKGHCKYDDTWAVILNRYPYPINFTEEDIELYTKESMKENKREGWSEAFEKYAKEGEDEKLLPDHLDSEAIKALDDKKELNLCELLNLGDIIYNPTFGYGRVDLVNTDIKPYFCVSFEDAVVSLSFLHNGIEANSNSRPSIWPNEELYEKYPLDAYSAWMEWKEERNKKTWLRVNVFSEEGDVLIDKYIINITQKRSDQVVEEINKVLQKFHEKNSEE